ncbi:hypothetical protein ACQP0C_17975 [Nocardia sp. CA-129566]|uniref:hypothetical protein n=1 Tax=Nocardia sp. CA-129566 TaxID=3239976 RepID=UPI003D98EF0C
MAMYIAHSRQTLSGIASRFGVGAAALTAADPQIVNPNLSGSSTPQHRLRLAEPALGAHDAFQEVL